MKQQGRIQRQRKVYITVLEYLLTLVGGLTLARPQLLA